jgi:hypothetical protein
MTTTQVPPPPGPVQQESPHPVDDKADAIHGDLRARVPEPGPKAAAARSQDGTFEPKWGMTMMLRDVAYLLRLTRRTSTIDF